MKHTLPRCILTLFLCLAILIPTIPTAAAATVAEDPKTPFNAQTVCLYTAMRLELEKVASGARTNTHLVFDEEALKQMGAKTRWTAAELGVTVIGAAERPLVSEKFFAQFEGVSYLVDALIHDMPGSLYWFDKTKGMAQNLVFLAAEENATTITVSEYHTYFRVSAHYVGADSTDRDPTVDPDEIARANTAIAVADAIVERYAALPDYRKLLAYRDEICALVDYNNDAISQGYTGGYGDPWQMIYVFDGDPDTRVVCEGYSKAFAYLCSKSQFAADISCRTATGYTWKDANASSPEGHMWNVLTIDGVSYLVDVTNSDAGTVGQNGELFLAGYDAVNQNTYRFDSRNDEVYYLYDASTLFLWQESGTLSLSSTDYTPPSFEIVLPSQEPVYTGAALTVGQDGTDADIIYRTAALPAGYYQWTVEWYQNGESMTDAPILPGTYRLKITATNALSPLLSYTEERDIVIHRALPEYTAPTDLCATYGDLLSSVALPQGFAWKTPDTSVGDAGTQFFDLIYTPDNLALYRPVTLRQAVSILPKDISEATVHFGPFPTYTGQPIDPEILKVVLDGEEVTCTVSGELSPAVGDYTLTFTGYGNYCGTVTAEWSILPDPNTPSGTDGAPLPDQKPNSAASFFDDMQTVIIVAASGLTLLMLAVIIIAVSKKKR